MAKKSKEIAAIEAAQIGAVTGIPPLPTEAEIQKRVVDPVIARDDERFDLAIVLNGTVSSGAYTAGVLDFLIEALDCWHAAQQNAKDGDGVAMHRVNLVLAAGASGGGVCAAILARLLEFEFPHVRIDTPAEEAARNPFYNTWVKQLTIEQFAKLDDLQQKQPLRSLLNSLAIDHAGKAIVNYRGLPLGTKTSPSTRAYLNDPFRVIFTLSNLKGIPYRIDFSNVGKGAQHFVDHADWVSFRRHLDAAEPGEPHEFTLVEAAAGPDEADWNTLAEYAKATAAFPGGFAARTLTRPVSHYFHRAVVVPGADGKNVWRALHPALDLLGPVIDRGRVTFNAVDGGTLNNAPVEIARTRLAGLLGRNPRAPDKAHAGVLLIDPFAELPELTTKGEALGLVGTLASTLGTLIGQARYATADLLLAAEEDICSRFMITPATARGRGSSAIATSGLGAFLGFFDERYRRHDYLLGRANAQLYIQQELALHPTNPVFTDAGGAAATRDTFTDDGKQWRRLIPLHGSASEPQPVPPWPSGIFDRPAIEAHLRQRIGQVVDRATDELKIGGWLTSKLIEAFGDKAIADGLVDRALGEIDKALRKAGL